MFEASVFHLAPYGLGRVFRPIADECDKEAEVRDARYRSGQYD
jgi:hypothetical protein